MRKTLILLAALATLVMIMGSCAARETLSIYNWSYYTPESVIKKFEAEYGVKVIYDEFASNEEMYAKIIATNKEGILGRFFQLFSRQYDIIFPSGYFVPIMIQQGLLEKIDRAQIPNLKNIDPAVLEKAIYDPNMDYSVPYFWGAAGIAVNTAMVPDYERDWSIFARTDLRGRMTMLDDMREVMGNALAYLGYSVNSKNPAEIDAAKDLINSQWKPNLAKFDSDSFGKGYANGEFWVVHAFAEVVFEEIADNEELMRDTVFFIPPRNGPAFVDNMCILKGTKNFELAHKFIDFIHRPEIYAEFCDSFGFPATVNVPARQFKTGTSWYEIEDLSEVEPVNDLGPIFELYNDAWFHSIRTGN
ncbi:MAG: extracellular solute-binding protein [Treponema sp.]|jgi:spermidine/putrescine transport system substrate-binding protein|nr:extracellular solute-binding protein [Treponema sp.]